MIFVEFLFHIFFDKKILVNCFATYYFFICKKYIQRGLIVPIVFIFFGCIFLLILFDYIPFNNFYQKYFLLCLSLIIMLSYFLGDCMMYSVSFNILHLISVLFLLVFSMRNYLKGSVFISVLVAIIYKYLVNANLSHLVNINYNFVVLLILVVYGILSNNFSRWAFSLVLGCVFIAILSAVESLDNFGILYFDFAFLYESLVGLYLICIMKNSFGYFKSFKRGNYDVKKINFNANSNIYAFGLLF